MNLVYKIALAGAVVCAAGLWVTRPQGLPADALTGLTPDAENGALVFAAMGCASCHMAPETEDRTRLAGGKAFVSDFGTFYAPNISTDADFGIGAWSDQDIATAVLKGTSPESQHYYPAFPYASYVHAETQDVVDMIAHLRTLAPVPEPSKPHDVGFPFNIRASLGGWKLLFVSDAWVMTGDLSPEVERGRYLVEGLGHCGECHTPRNALGAMQRNAWLAGAPIPGGEGRTPDIRPQTLQWGAADIVNYLKSGFTPEFDTAGGEMFDVIGNTSQLPDSDLSAIAAYLLALPGTE